MELPDKDVYPLFLSDLIFNLFHVYTCLNVSVHCSFIVTTNVLISIWLYSIHLVVGPCYLRVDLHFITVNFFGMNKHTRHEALKKTS